ncbi:hypothetical protein TVAG_173780 [Trichomonas vaginalis G3]|uniref:Uncharacterized protein n=1 Tax=Trichomonas vaginalis (strain ATCC PRA-98 / G3) TaxID=412133 RepID=A2EVK0_TRIV3|nr:hypothetical protein TVAGG3_0827100 [Trichomonas vaginalis G3]EAY03332.1 hypothetical protein TVAG_173780 [Trichomonas vaginalis G3]KAI5498319.1 hypothetical protein TVAGG3_0827100 [Trichomonas vaginalis G3]|eukprot:XP_001315555.1 hypothetical protein [Trichomonas vaginalis G3]
MNTNLSFGSYILIENYTFLGNTGPGKEFFQESSGSITVKDPFCDRIINKTGSVTLNNVENIYSIHHLSHFSTYLYETEFPILDVKKNIITYDEIVYHYSYRLMTSLCVYLLNS